MTITKVNWFTEDGDNFFAAFCGEEHDTNGDIPAGVDPEEWLQALFPLATVREIDANP